METGGAFGGKEEYPSIIAAHAALLAMKSGRPVKIIYDRMEDMAATTKRHPSRTRHRTAVSKDGKILGGEIEFVDRRRGLRDAVAGGAFTGHHSCRRRLLLAQCPHNSQGCGHEYPAPRRVPRLRRSAKSVRARTAHGSYRASSRPFAGRDSQAKLLEAGTDDNHGTSHPRTYRSGTTSRSCAGTLRLSRQETTLRKGK